MVRTVPFTAFFARVFFARFAAFVDQVMDMYERNQVAMASFASGFPDRLLAQTMLGRWGEQDG